MNQHNQHGHGHHQQHHAPAKGLHKDWRLWTAVVLMLIAIGAYILSLDEEVQPGGGPPQPNAPADMMPADG